MAPLRKDKELHKKGRGSSDDPDDDFEIDNGYFGDANNCEQEGDEDNLDNDMFELCEEENEIDKVEIDLKKFEGDDDDAEQVDMARKFAVNRLMNYL